MSQKILSQIATIRCAKFYNGRVVELGKCLIDCAKAMEANRRIFGRLCRDFWMSAGSLGVCAGTVEGEAKLH